MIDLDANAALSATAAPPCYFLLNVVTAGEHAAALCSLDAPITKVVAIGL
jgi:hypothetical protein